MWKFLLLPRLQRLPLSQQHLHPLLPMLPQPPLMLLRQLLMLPPLLRLRLLPFQVPHPSKSLQARENWLQDPFSHKAPYRKVGAFFAGCPASALSHLYPGSSLVWTGHSDLFCGPVQRQ